MMTPLPSPRLGLAALVAKEELEPGSLLRGSRTAALLVLMLTTAGEALCAATLRLPGAGNIRGCPGRLDQGNACARAGGSPVDPVGLERGHDKIGGDQHRHGLRNSSQMRFMEINGKWLRYCRASACARPAGQ